VDFKRREFLRMATLGCACCLAARSVGAAQPGHGAKQAAHPHWTYAGNTGPQHWGELQPDFKVCQLGLEQTPIDLTASIKGEPGVVSLNYKPVAARIVNNGHTIQANIEPGCSCTIGNAKYDLVQFHFHHPSEHLLAGKPFDLECHFVHKAQNGALAVVGVFIQPGARNADLATVFDVMPAQEGEARTSVAINPAALMPREGGYFRYMGSLTTPPCSEGLTWTVYKQPIEASPDQIKQFASLFVNNARPIQRRNRRFLIETN
jgi:carbonic anhydrase